MADFADPLDMLDDMELELELQLEEVETKQVSRLKTGKRKRLGGGTTPGAAKKSMSVITPPTSAPSSPNDSEDGGEAELEFDEPPEDDYDLDDEEAAQKVLYQETVDDAVDEPDGDDDYQDDSGSDSENEEATKFSVRRQKAEPGGGDGEDEEFHRLHGRKAPATSKDMILEMRKENQKLRKSVPIQMPKRGTENSAKVSLFDLLKNLKAKQPELPQDEEPVPDIQDEMVSNELVGLCRELAKNPADAAAAEAAEDSEDSEVEDADKAAAVAEAGAPAGEVPAGDAAASAGGAAAVELDQPPPTASATDEAAPMATDEPPQKPAAEPEAAAAPAAAPTGGAGLSAEVMARIERNKAIAMAKRAARLSGASSPTAAPGLASSAPVAMQTEAGADIGATKDSESAAAAAPAADADAMDEDEDTAAEAAATAAFLASTAEFIEKAEFCGAKKGYCFHLGSQGVGYYTNTAPEVELVQAGPLSKLVEYLGEWLGVDPAGEKAELLSKYGWNGSGFTDDLPRGQFATLGEAISTMNETVKAAAEAAKPVEVVEEEEDSQADSQADSQPDPSLEDDIHESELALEGKDGTRWSPAKLRVSRVDMLGDLRAAQLAKRIALKNKFKQDQGLQDALAAAGQQNAEGAGGAANVESEDEDYEVPLDDALAFDEEADMQVDEEPVEPATLVDGEGGEAAADGAGGEVLLTDEEKEAAAAEVAAAAEEAAAEKREERRLMIERRKNQILELRKMALEDRAARKAQKRAQKTGLFEVDAEQETDDEESDDDDEVEAERQAIEELRAADYLDDGGEEAGDTDDHRKLLAEQMMQDQERYLKARGDMFDDNGNIVRHGRNLKRLLKQNDGDEDATIRPGMDDSSDSSDSDSDSDSEDENGSPKQTSARAFGAIFSGGESQAGKEQDPGGGAEDATTQVMATEVEAVGSNPKAEAKAKKRKHKKMVKRMRRAAHTAATGKASQEKDEIDDAAIHQELSNMVSHGARGLSRSRSAPVSPCNPTSSCAHSLRCRSRPHRQQTMHRG